MGNAFEKKSTLLTKHWSQIGPDTYRNTITNQIILSHQLPIHSEEEMSFQRSLLMKRAALSHPNVPKLIYFSPSSAPLCSSAKSSLLLYLQLTEVDPLRTTSIQKKICPCCGIASGILYLSDRYGLFELKEGMVRWGYQGLHNQSMMIPKVWISDDPKINHPQKSTSQSRMCQQLVIILTSLNKYCNLHKQLPSNIKKIRSFTQLVQKIFEEHNETVIVPRKRVISQQLDRSQKTYEIPNKERSQNINHRGEAIANYPPKIVKQSQISLSSLRITEKKIDPIPIMKKVNICFNHGCVTPKSQRPALPTQQSQSRQHPSAETQIAQLTLSNSSNKERVPLLSFVNIKESEVVIQEEECQSRLKQLMSRTDRDPSSSTVGTQPNNYNNVSEIIRNEVTIDNNRQPILLTSPQKEPEETDRPQQAPRQQVVVVKESEDDKNSSEKISAVDIESLGSMNEKSGGMQIVSQFQMVLQPSPTLNNLTIEHSQEYMGSEPDKFPPCPFVKSKQVLSYNNSYSMNHTSLEKPSQPSSQFIPQRQQGLNGSYQGQIVKKHLSNLQEVNLSESHLPQCYASRSERNYSNKEVVSETQDQAKYLTSSNRPYRQPQNKPASKGSSKRLPHFGRSEDSESMSNYSCEEEMKRAKIMAKINSTQEVLRQNRKKLQRLQLEKDLQRQKSLIKKEMESLLVSNMMADESQRIKEKVKSKKATFAQLKAEASKILEDLDF